MWNWCQQRLFSQFNQGQHNVTCHKSPLGNTLKNYAIVVFDHFAIHTRQLTRNPKHFYEIFRLFYNIMGGITMLILCVLPIYSNKGNKKKVYCALHQAKHKIISGRMGVMLSQSTPTSTVCPTARLFGLSTKKPIKASHFWPFVTRIHMRPVTMRQYYHVFYFLSLHFGPSYSFMIFEMGPRTFARTKAIYAEKSIVTVGSIKQNGQNISHLHIFAITVCVDLLTNNHHDVIKTLLCTWLRKLCIDFLCRVPHLSHRIFACKCRLRNMPKPANSCHNWI